MTAIKDVAEGRDPSEFTLSDEISVKFMRSIKADYGNNVAVDVMNHLQTTLGKGWAGRVIFNMMADHHQNYEQLILSVDPVTAAAGNLKKINCIKAVRALTGMGLGESKNFVEEAMAGRTQKARIDLSWKADTAERHRLLRDEVDYIRSAGFKVSVL